MVKSPGVTYKGILPLCLSKQIVLPVSAEFFFPHIELLIFSVFYRTSPVRTKLSFIFTCDNTGG